MTNAPQEQVRVAKMREGISVAKRINVVIDVVINVTIDDAPA
ncbi:MULTISPECIES: hypothetical protein [Raoultella]|nr:MULTISPECIES: hypothetical protein [Raoultella]MCS4271636.1 hypothetical protein [Raoultella sp. BIGb0132]MCS4288055.1 hypothetical protein [Raoultella terrigena]